MPARVPKRAPDGTETLVGVVALETIEVRRYRLRAGSKRTLPLSGEPLVHLAFIERGGLNVSLTARGDQRWRVTAGQGLFLRSNRDYLFSRPDDTEMTIVTAPERIVHGFGARIDDSQGPVFAAGSALLAPVAAYFRALVGGEGAPDRVAKYAMSRLAEEMIGSLFLERNSLSAATGPVRVQAPLYHQALALIASRRSDPALTIPQMASELAVSVRHLQRAFQERGTSPTEEIRRLRVELAQSLLTDARFDVLSIEEIAQHAGFGSADDLRRAFRLQNVMPPSRLRAESRAERAHEQRLVRIGDRSAHIDEPLLRRA